MSCACWTTVLRIPRHTITGCAFACCGRVYRHLLLRSRPPYRAPALAPLCATSEPDAVLAFYDTLVIHDYARARTKIVSVAGPERLAKIHDAIKDAATNLKARMPGKTEADGRSSHQPHPFPLDLSVAFSDSALTSNFTRDEYVAAVHCIKTRIAAGDIYQANLTQQLSIKVAEDLRPEHIFLRLRGFHPASFAAFIRRRKDTVITPRLSVLSESKQAATRPPRRVEAWPSRARDRAGAMRKRMRACAPSCAVARRIAPRT